MNKYLRFYSPSLAPAASAQHVLINVSKMTTLTFDNTGGGDFDLVFFYGDSKDFQILLTFTPDLGAIGYELVSHVSNIITELCAEGNNDVYADVGTTDGIKIPLGAAGVVFNLVLTEVQRAT